MTHHLMLCAIAAASQAQDVPPVLADSVALRTVTTAIHIYHQQHGTFPPTLGDTYPLVQHLEAYVSVLQPGPDDVPDDPGAWINANASFDYLPHVDVDMNDVPDWGEVVIAHLDLTAGHATEPTPDNPEGLSFPVAFLDGHVRTLPLAEARRRIDESTQLFEGLATGGPVPERFQVVIDMRTVSSALRAYADAHQGVLPPTIGHVLDFVPTTKRTTTLRDKAAVFLSPARAQRTFIPEQPTPEWVDRNTSIEYLGADDLFLNWIEDPARIILLRTRDTIELGGTDVVTISTAVGGVTNELEDYADAIADESTRVIRALARTDRLPDLQHVMRDLRLISDAAQAYARAHDGALPDTLGDLLPHLPDDPLTDAYAPLTPDQRARVFLSPADEAGIVPPDEPSAAWVNSKSSYVWLASGHSLRRLREAGVVCMLHAPLDEPLEGATRTESDGFVPFVDTFGGIAPVNRAATESIARDAAEAIKNLDD